MTSAMENAPVPPTTAAAPAAPPLSRLQLVACAVLICAATLILHHEVILGRSVYHMDDAADNYYPSRVAGTRTLASGHLPVWDRGSWSGWPLNADPYYGFFYPLNLTFYLGGMVRGLGYSIALHVVLAAAGMFWLLRRRRLDVGPALLGAVALAFGTFMAVRVRHIIFPQMLAWTPFVLVGVEGFLATGRRRELLLVAGAVGMSLLCGAAPLVPFWLMVLGAYIVPRVLSSDAPSRLRALGAITAAGLVGLLIGAVQILPPLAHLPESPRALGAGYRFASSYAWPDLSYLATLIVPDLFGVEERGRWFGAFNHWEMAGFYSGALVVLLAPLALRSWRRLELVGLAVVAVLGILLAFGAKGPLHRFFFDHVPLYGALRCPTRALVMGLLGLPILGAHGLAVLLARAPRPGRRVVGVGVAALVLIGGAVGYAVLTRSGRLTPAEVMAHGAFAHLIAVVGGGAAVLALALTGVIGRRVGGVGLALITLAELVVLGRGYLQPKPSDWAPGTERYAALDWILAQPSHDRFIVAHGGPHRLLNVGMTYDRESPAGYGSALVWRYVDFIWTLNHGAPYAKRPVDDDLAATWIERFDSPLVDLLNVRWVIGWTSPGRRWIERFRPAAGAPPHARHEASWDARLRVYENPDALPRAFVVYGAVVAPDDAAQARALTRLDPRQTVVLDRPPSPAPIGDGRPFDGATITRADSVSLTIRAHANAAGVLVVSETWYPGWRATVDGVPAPLLRADYAFRGVALAAGDHVVELRYRSRPTEIGLGLSGLGLLGLGGLGLLRRRQPRPAPSSLAAA
jgi:MYXO-CTERM domain-containing protein